MISARVSFVAFISGISNSKSLDRREVFSSRRLEVMIIFEPEKLQRQFWKYHIMHRIFLTISSLFSAAPTVNSIKTITFLILKPEKF